MGRPDLSERRVYALTALIVFTVEIVIALFVADNLIRPYAGDALAVVLVYLVLRAAMSWRLVPALAAALMIAIVIELGQLIHVLDIVGLGHNRWARTVFGGVFDLRDFAAYAGGGVIVALGEHWRRRIGSSKAVVRRA